MEFLASSLPGVIKVMPVAHEDPRGFFMETWQAQRFAEAGIETSFVQDNLSQSSRWTLRGLHYQVERPQGKLARVVSGEVFDVFVDLRRSSPTFGQWGAERLSCENRVGLWIPPGFAHGFLVLSETALFEYKCTEFYSAEHDRALHWNDPDIGIEWPLPAGVEPLLSEKDAAAPLLKDAETYP